MRVAIAILIQTYVCASARQVSQLDMGLLAQLPIIGKSTALIADKTTQMSQSLGGAENGEGPSNSRAQESNQSDWKMVSEDPTDTKFLLYSHKFQVSAGVVAALAKSGVDAPEYLEFGNLTSVTKSQFDPKKPTKVITHGFTMSHTSCTPQNIIGAYLSLTRKDFNLIVVDWAPLAIPKLRYIGAAWYATTALNTVKVGERTGDFLVWLHNQFLIELERLHLLGFSLGAHVVGKAGAQVQAKLGKSVGRITGLDPAGPLFYTGIFARRLSPGDANYVDVIHTNSNGYGTWGTLGQVDFFVNGGGGFQPGCVTLEAQVTILANFAQGLPVRLYYTIICAAFCSHVAVSKLYADSIMSGNNARAKKDFTVCPCPTEEAAKTGACPCEKMVTFGEYSTPGTRGKIFVTYKKNMYQECKGPDI